MKYLLCILIYIDFQTLMEQDDLERYLENSSTEE